MPTSAARTAGLLAAVALLAASGAGATVTHQSTNTTAGDASSFSFNHTVEADSNLIVVEIGTDKGQTMSSVTFAGQAMTEVATLDNGGKAGVSMWYLTDPPTGNDVVEVTMSAKDKFSAAASTFSGVYVTTPTAGLQTATGTSTTPSVTVSSEPDDLVIDLASADDGALSPGSGQTERWNRPHNDGSRPSAGSYEAGAASVMMNWSLSVTKEWSIIGVSLQHDDPPVMAFVDPTPADGAILSTASATFNASTTDDVGIDTCRLEFDGTNETMTATGSGTAEYCSTSKTDMPEGDNTITAYVNDTLDQWNRTGTRTFTVDTTPPHVTDLAPVRDANVSASTAIELAANVTDASTSVETVEATVTSPNGSTRTVTLTQATAPRYTGSYDVPELAGRYNVTFTATDTAGNVNDTRTTYFRPVPDGAFLSPARNANISLGETVRVRFNVTFAADRATAVDFKFNGSTFPASEISSDVWERNITLSNDTTDGLQDITADLKNGTFLLNSVDLPVTVVPRLDGITATTDPIRGGDEQVIDPFGINDSDREDLRFFCSEMSTKPTASNTVCKETTTAYAHPYDLMQCSYDTATDTSNHTVYCRAYDEPEALYSPTRQVTFETDSTPPSLSITSVEGDTEPTYIDNTDDGSTTVVVEGESNMDCRYSTSDVKFSDMSSVNSCTVSGSTATCDIDAPQGVPDYYVACQDSLGNGNNASNNADVDDLLVDWTVPNTTTDAVTDIQVPPYTVTFTEDDNVDGDPDTLYCRDTTDTCSPGTAIDDGQSVTFDDTDRGENFLRFTSEDDAGNVQGPVSETVNINRIGTLDSASDNASTIQGGTTVAIASVSSDPDTSLGQSFTLHVCNATGASAAGCDAGTYCTATGTSDLSCTFTSERDDTTHMWHAYMFDDAGEEFTGSPMNGSYTTDSTGPNITILDPDNITYTQPDVPADIDTDEAAATAFYSLNGTPNVSMSQVSSTSFSATIEDLNGTYTIRFWANDSYDNWGVSTVRHFTVNLSGTDLTPPSLTVRSPLNDSFHSTDILLNVTSNENLSYMDYELDGTTNASMGNVSPKSWNATIGAPGLSEGAHTVVFYANDTAEVPNPGRSKTIHLTYDVTAPEHSSAGVDPAGPRDNESATCSARWTDNVELASGTVEENSSGTFTNRSIALTGTDGWTNYTILAADLEPGTVTCRFHANDTTGNANKTGVTFTVTDVTPPGITNVANDPSTTEALDPHVQVNVTANVSDGGGVDHVVLRYRNASTTSWTNASMTATQGTGYRGSFTPDTADNWTYRVWANDTAGLVNTSADVTLAIRNETTFSVSDTVPTAKSRVRTDDPLMDFGNVTVTNTGDTTINISTTANVSWVTFNGTTDTTLDITLAGGEAVTFNVTANTTGFPVDEFPFRISVAGTRNGTAVNTTTIDTKAIIQQVAGPLLELSIEEFSSQVDKGDEDVEYKVKVENVGTKDATGTWLAWELPDEFSLDSGTLNRSIGTLIIGGSATNTITIDVGTGFSDRTVTVSALTAADQNTSDRIDRDVDIGTPPTTEDTDTSTTTTSSGASQETTSNILTGSRFLNTSRTVHLVRGVNTSFPVRVTNIFEGTTMYNVSIRFDGPFGPRFVGIPSRFPEIAYEESRVFTVNVTSPVYLEPGTEQLDVIVTGDIRGSRIRQTFVQQQDVTLRIHAVSRAEAAAAIEEAAASIDDLAAVNRSTRVASDLLERAREAIAADDWDRAKELADRAVALRQAALETDGILAALEDRIATSQTPTGRALGVEKRYEETQELMRLTRAAMERGAYDTGLQRAREAQLAFEAERATFDPVHFILGHWWMLLIAAAALAAMAVVGRRQYRRATIADRIADFTEEEETVLDLMRDTQEAYYVDEEMGKREYEDAMDRHRERLADIRAERIELRNTRISLLQPEQVKENLAAEREQVMTNLQALQTAFFEEEAVPEAAYRIQSEAYWQRLTEIERENVRIRIQETLEDGDLI